MVLTAQTLLHGPARYYCASRTSGSVSSLSHRLNGLACDASLVAVAVVMVVMGMAVALEATWGGTWLRRCEGMQCGTGQCMGEAGGAQWGVLMALQCVAMLCRYLELDVLACPGVCG